MKETIDSFAARIVKILKTDRWVFIACSGDMGEGKSCFTSQVAKATAIGLKRKFDYHDSMTYLRDELKVWIDGDQKGKGRKPEYSVILADEIISMFFKRNWYDNKQIDGIELLNKCRDRHHLVLGNVPNFWDLDSAVYATITFWVHIHERGRAWVFQKDRNPFTPDKWHRKMNEKLFIKHKNPYRCPNFVCEIHFPDWTDKEREEYYAVRNEKRKFTEGQREDFRYKDIKAQRDACIRLLFKLNNDMTNQDVAAEIVTLSPEAIRAIRQGIR